MRRSSLYACKSRMCLLLAVLTVPMLSLFILRSAQIYKRAPFRSAFLRHFLCSSITPNLDIAPFRTLVLAVCAGCRHRHINRNHALSTSSAITGSRIGHASPINTQRTSLSIFIISAPLSSCFWLLSALQRRFNGFPVYSPMCGAKTPYFVSPSILMALAALAKSLAAS